MFAKQSIINSRNNSFKKGLKRETLSSFEKQTSTKPSTLPHKKKKNENSHDNTRKPSKIKTKSQKVKDNRRE